MKAVRYIATGQAPELIDIPTPTPGPGQVLLRIAGAGVCPTSAHSFESRMPNCKLNSRSAAPRIGRRVAEQIAVWISSMHAASGLKRNSLCIECKPNDRILEQN